LSRARLRRGKKTEADEKIKSMTAHRTRGPADTIVPSSAAPDAFYGARPRCRV
jgi:hypothetical protein